MRTRRTARTGAKWSDGHPDSPMFPSALRLRRDVGIRLGLRIPLRLRSRRWSWCLWIGRMRISHVVLPSTRGYARYTGRGQTAEQDAAQLFFLLRRWWRGGKTHFFFSESVGEGGRGIQWVIFSTSRNIASSLPSDSSHQPASTFLPSSVTCHSGTSSAMSNCPAGQ